MSTILDILKKYFLSGIIVVVPILITYVVIKFVFELIDPLLEPLIIRFLGYSFPGLGVVVAILLVFLAGILTRNFIGASIHQIIEIVLERLPIIRPIYSAAKQLLVAVTLPSIGSFKEVVLVEYPRKGVYMLSFVSKRMNLTVEGRERQYIVVFVPSTPTPISGMTVVVDEEEVTFLEMTVEDAVKFLVSGGVASPETLKTRIKVEKQKNGVLGETR